MKKSFVYQKQSKRNNNNNRLEHFCLSNFFLMRNKKEIERRKEKHFGIVPIQKFTPKGYDELTKYCV